MKKILSTAVLALAILPFTATPATADYYQQVCIQYSDGNWYPYVIETPEDEAAIAGYPQQPFPNTAAGCSSYNSTPKASEPCEPQVIETTSVQVVRDPEDVETIRELRAKVRKLRAKLNALRNQ